jgi:hypothetical protein
MDGDLFKLMLQEQQTLRQQYYANQKTKNIIRTICNRKYKSKGDKGLEEIRESLKGYLDEMILNNSQSGDLCFESLYGK